MTHTGIIYNDRFLEHITGSGAMSLPPREDLSHHISHPECPERIANAYAILTSSGFINSLILIEPLASDIQTIEFVHEKGYIKKIKQVCESGGGRVDNAGFTPVSKKSYEIALLGVGGCIRGVDYIMGGDIDNAYALIRPPGHHAVRNEAMGYCLFNNVAVTAEYLKRKHGVGKILIVDWDVHHGNGTQSIFYEDPSVLFISLHQDGNFPPDSGNVEEVGKGKGKGFNVNIPFTPCTGDEGYVYAFRKILEPVCEQFAPDFILVSAGQDSALLDPLGRNAVTYSGFREMTSILKMLAGRYCNGRLLIVQEGGYDIIYQAFSVLTIIEELSDTESGITKPFDGYKYPETRSYKADVQNVITQHQSYWKL